MSAADAQIPDKKRKVVIATYSKRKAIRFVSVAFLSAVFILAVTLQFSGGVIAPASSSLRFGFGLQVIAWICGLLGLLISGAILWQLVLESGHAIWIQNGYIVYLHRWYRSVDWKEVSDVTFSSSGGTQVIVLQLRGGRRIEIHPGLLFEPCERIVEQLELHLTRA